MQNTGDVIILQTLENIFLDFWVMATIVRQKVAKTERMQSYL